MGNNVTDVSHPVARALAVDLAQELETAQAHVVALKAENSKYRAALERLAFTPSADPLVARDVAEEALS